MSWEPRSKGFQKKNKLSVASPQDLFIACPHHNRLNWPRLLLLNGRSNAWWCVLHQIKSNEIHSHPLTQQLKSICLVQSHIINITDQHHHGYLNSSPNYTSKHVHVASADGQTDEWYATRARLTLCPRDLRHTPPHFPPRVPSGLVLANGQISCGSQHANPRKFFVGKRPSQWWWCHQHINLYIYILWASQERASCTHKYTYMYTDCIEYMYKIYDVKDLYSQQKEHWITAQSGRGTCLQTVSNLAQDSMNIWADQNEPVWNHPWSKANDLNTTRLLFPHFGARLICHLWLGFWSTTFRKLRKTDTYHFCGGSNRTRRIWWGRLHIFT